MMVPGEGRILFEDLALLRLLDMWLQADKTFLAGRLKHLVEYLQELRIGLFREGIGLEQVQHFRENPLHDGRRIRHHQCAESRAADDYELVRLYEDRDLPMVKDVSTDDAAPNDDQSDDDEHNDIPGFDGFQIPGDESSSPSIGHPARKLDRRRRSLMGAPLDGDQTAWNLLSDGLIAGIHHAINNRMAALGGAVQVLQGDVDVDHPLMGLLSSEIRRLESTATLLRYLGAGDGIFEPVQVTEVLGQASRLFEIHHALRDLRLNIEAPQDLLPVWTVPNGLLRSALLMICAVGGGIARTGGLGGATTGMGIELRVFGDPVSVRIVANVPNRLDDAELPPVSKLDMSEIAQRIGAVFNATDLTSVSRWELELPTLPEARRREREGYAAD